MTPTLHSLPYNLFRQFQDEYYIYFLYPRCVPNLVCILGTTCTALALDVISRLNKQTNKSKLHHDGNQN